MNTVCAFVSSVQDSRQLARQLASEEGVVGEAQLGDEVPDEVPWW
jgi:hypothetical protein